MLLQPLQSMQQAHTSLYTGDTPGPTLISTGPNQLPVAGHTHAEVPFRLEPWWLERPLEEGVRILEPAPGGA